MRAMKVIIIVISLLLTISGCSTAGGSITPEVLQPLTATYESSNHWSWGYWTVHFSADHANLEVIPQRYGNYHFCVTKFVEKAPCPDCLVIGKPKVQDDGTVKLDVTLSHPFKNMPYYTGFDVRGVVYFPPTSYHMAWDLHNHSWLYPGHQLFPNQNSSMPLNFSRAEESGGELLNQDGYSCYLIPGITYSAEWQIFSYYPGKYGNEPTPELTTVNPYKLFASDTERRMFLVTDTITREYHFVLPPGEFCFGYAVDASWWPPNNTPVTDPATDFPKAANAEDPWLIEYEQLLPINEENVEKDIFKVTVHDRGTNKYKYWTAMIFSWDLSTSELYDPENWQFTWPANEVIDGFTLTGNGKLDFWWFHSVKSGLVPGHHLGVLVVAYTTVVHDQQKAQAHRIYGVRFIDIYIE